MKKGAALIRHCFFLSRKSYQSRSFTWIHKEILISANTSALVYIGIYTVGLITPELCNLINIHKRLIVCWFTHDSYNSIIAFLSNGGIYLRDCLSWSMSKYELKLLTKPTNVLISYFIFSNICYASHTTSWWQFDKPHQRTILKFCRNSARLEMRIHPQLTYMQ